MKNFINSALAVSLVAGLASCSSDELVVNGNEGLVTFTAQLPGTLSRAYGEGANATKLQFAVYEHGSKSPLKVHGSDAIVGTAEIKNLTAKVSVALAQGKEYDFVFWASSDINPYTFNAETQQIVANYSEVNANDENLDAFYGNATVTVKGATTGNITLSRPFAQINVCTTDKAAASAAGFNAAYTYVEVKGVCNTLNLMTGEATGNTDIIFNKAEIATEKCATTGHDQLSMNYVLVGKDGSTADIKHVTYHSESNVTITGEYTAVPVKANYRTNIYGALLTNPVDYNVTISAAFDGSNDVLAVWDGETKTAPQLNAAGDAYEVSTPAEFAYILSNAGVVKADSRASNVKTFNLTADINMGGKTLPTTTESFSYMTVNGNGHTISNFKAVNNGNNNVGLFSLGIALKVKNLKVENAVIGTDNSTGDAYAGVIAGTCYHSTFDSITVNNCTVNGINKVGGILGFAAENIATITNCAVKNTTLNGLTNDGGCVGGIIGYVGTYVEENAAVIENCSVENININVPNGKADASRGNGYLIGTVGTEKPVAIKDCTVSGTNTLVSNYTANELVGADRFGNANISVDGNQILTADLYIANYDALKAFAAKVNNGESYKGKTVVLVSDIDLNNEEWVGIGTENNTFQGTFDGANKTISNLKMTRKGENNVGFFGKTTDGAVKNLNIHNAEVTGRLNVGAVSGCPYSSAYSNITLTGDVKINGMAYVGGMFGKNLYKSADKLTINANAGSYVNANSIENGTAYRCYVGGVVGFMGEGNIVVSNVTSNINVTGTVCDAGGITGLAHYNNTFINCVAKCNVTLTDAGADLATEIGGIAGVWHNQDGTKVTFEECSYTGTLSSTNGAKTYDVSKNTITGSAYLKDGNGELINK
jgi:hypothetical protein